MSESFEFLPHTLSFHQTVTEPLTGLDESFLSLPAFENQPLEQVLTELMITLTPRQLAKRLALEPDDLPLPEPVQGQPWEENQDLPPLDKAEQRLYQIFNQLLRDQRKSSKYLQAFEALCEQYPESEHLQQLRANYYLTWQGRSAAQALLSEKLTQHPGWLWLRLMLARTYLHDDQVDVQGFRASLAHKLNLHEHLPGLETPLTDLLIYQFHLDLYLFFSLQGNLRRATYCFSACHENISDPSILQPLAVFVLAGVPEDGFKRSFNQLLRFVRAV